MPRVTVPISSGASVTWHCACQKCACIATVPASGSVCHNCAMGNHHG